MPEATHHILSLDMYATAGVGVLALVLGMLLTRRIPFLKRMCIPTPVSGGIIFSLLTLLIYSCTGLEIHFDGTIKDVCMMIFFTSVGFQSNFRVLKQGGRPLVMMVILVAILIVMQNFLSVGIAGGMGLSSLTGMAAGSIPMCGGHGTAGGFSALLESKGLTGASSITMAAATFGLVAGSLLGGPLAELLIRRHKITPALEGESADIEVTATAPEAKIEHIDTDQSQSRRFIKATYWMLIAMALGTLLSKLLALTGISFPTYFGSLLAAVILRNCSEFAPRSIDFSEDKIVAIGNVCLSLFLGMAMVSLRLWELSGLAIPLLVMLLSQVLLIALFAYFIAFPMLGGDYDAAVLVSGLCGFGLGATPNAMANMSAVCFKYRYAVRPFVIVPIVGAMFVDIINTTVITLFLNVIA